MFAPVLAIIPVDAEDEAVDVADGPLPPQRRSVVGRRRPRGASILGRGKCPQQCRWAVIRNFSSIHRFDTAVNGVPCRLSDNGYPLAPVKEVITGPGRRIGQAPSTTFMRSVPHTG